jgi:hypothetical protein
MSCPVCNHTMQNLGSPERRIFWCQRCGTLKEYTGDFSRVEMPLNLQHVLTAANLEKWKKNQSQHTQVSAAFFVHQFDEETPRIEQHLYDHNGRRIW